MFKFGPQEVWPGLAKVQEEMSELGVPLAKLVMVDGGLHWQGDLTRQIMDECADVLASVAWFVENNFNDEGLIYIMDRSTAKHRKYNEWHAHGEELPNAE